MKKIIFSKYANDRSINYKIRTDIVEDENGMRYIYKTATTKNSKRHIENMHTIYEKLDVQCKNSIFEPNKCTLEDNRIELEYVYGKSLENILDDYLYKKEFDKFKEILIKYNEEVRKMATIPFVKSEEYNNIFGEDADDSISEYSMEISNIDIIFPNVIVSDDHWIMLDYEWTFPISIPVGYVLYRTIHYYDTPERHSVFGNDINLYELFGLDENKSDIYMNMEKQFQTHVFSENTPLWKLYESMGKDIYFPIGMAQHISNENNIRRMQVLKNYGQGFEGVSEYMTLEPDGWGNVEFDIDVEENIQTVRIDPAERKCIVNITKLVGIAKEDYDINYGTNGESSDNRLVCFDTMDPQIWIGDFREGLTKIHVEYNIEYPNDEMINLFKSTFMGFSSLKVESEKYIAENEKYKMDVILLEEQNRELHIKSENYENLYNQVANSTSWKVTKPLRKIKSLIKRGTQNETE